MDRALTAPGLPAGQRGSSARGHILVIEDDPVVRFNMVSYLEDSGYRVSEQDNGTTGVEAALAQAPDLVLCDLRMPGLDGLDVIACLGRERPDLPVVVVSGTGVLGDAVEALRVGAADFITKPIQDMRVLEHAIDAALEKARLVHENRQFQAELERANEQLRRYVGQLEQDAVAGRKLQQQLMPPSERVIGGYRFSRFLLPSLHLSGDFVDYFAIDAARVAVYIADVSGHGVSSAFVTVLLKSLIDRHVDRHQDEGDGLILDPARLLARLNRDLLAQGLDKYLTIFFGIIDTVQNRLTFCNAGHFPTPALYDGSAAAFVDRAGFPVGLMAAATYENTTLALPDDPVLVLASDGVLDALPEAHLADRNARLLDAAARPGLDMRMLLDALGLDTDGAYPDDIALLIIERTVQT